MPPRHGKSETVSRYLPAWYLGRFPDRRVMLASYEAHFAATWGRKARELLEQVGPEVFGVSVSERSAAASAWDIAGRRGGMVTAGVGGPLTGKGAHLLVIDDPVKNAEEAQSELLREKAFGWWRSTARTRLERGGAVGRVTRSERCSAFSPSSTTRPRRTCDGFRDRRTSLLEGGLCRSRSGGSRAEHAGEPKRPLPPP